MLIMMNSDNKKRGKAWKCENQKDSFRFTWCTWIGIENNNNNNDDNNNNNNNNNNNLIIIIMV